MSDTVQVVLFKSSGKYYTEEPWRIPEGAIGPYDMDRSPDFRRIGGGAVLVDSQEPWGFPHLFPGVVALALADEVEDLCDCDAYRANDPEWHDPACPTGPLRAALESVTGVANG